MAELDLLSPEGFVQDARGPLLIRTAAVEPPQHPLGPSYNEPHWGIFASAKRIDHGWVCMFATNDVERSLATLDDEDDLRRIERLSILLGAPWVEIVKGAKEVSDRQEAALKALPPEIYESPPEQLREFRGIVKAVDPLIVATALGMTVHWQTDPGGTRGPRFPA